MLISLSIFIFFLGTISPSFAQTSPPQELYKAEVTEIISEGETFVEGHKSLPYQIVTVKILDGSQKDKQFTVEHGKTTSIRENQKSTYWRKNCFT